MQTQKLLQLRIEQNGEFLRKLMEEHRKVLPVHDLPSVVIPTAESVQLPRSPSPDVSSPRQADVRSDCPLGQPSIDKASDSTRSREARCHKRCRGECSPKGASI